MLTDGITINLRGTGFRVFVLSDGVVGQPWQDLPLPSGVYSVDGSISGERFRGLSLRGPSIEAALAEREISEWVFEGSILGLVDGAGLYDPGLGGILAREAREGGSSRAFAKVVRLSESRAELLLVGPTGWAGQASWSVTWQTGGGLPSKLVLAAWDG